MPPRWFPSILVQPLVPQGSVVALDVAPRQCLSDQWRSDGSMLRLAGLDVPEGDLGLFGPFQQRAADVFRAIVDADGAWLAAPFDDPVQV